MITCGALVIFCIVFLLERSQDPSASPYCESVDLVVTKAQNGTKAIQKNTSWFATLENRYLPTLTGIDPNLKRTTPPNLHAVPSSAGNNETYQSIMPSRFSSTSQTMSVTSFRVHFLPKNFKCSHTSCRPQEQDGRSMGWFQDSISKQDNLLLLFSHPKCYQTAVILKVQEQHQPHSPRL